jgi:hypothetical protein
VEGFFRFDRIPGGGAGVEDDEVGLTVCVDECNVFVDDVCVDV